MRSYLPADKELLGLLLHNINNFSRLYRRSMAGLGVSGGIVRIELQRIKARIILVLSHVTVEDKTNAVTKLRLGITNGGVNHYLQEMQTISAGNLCVCSSDLILGEGDVFFAELTGTVDGDGLVMTCVGWEINL